MNRRWARSIGPYEAVPVGADYGLLKIKLEMGGSPTQADLSACVDYEMNLSNSIIGPPAHIQVYF